MALPAHKEVEPRLGVAYNVKKTNTVLRVSYARLLETPFNENLVLSSTGCANAVLNPLLGCTVPGVTPFNPGFRNEFHAGIQQAFGRYLVFSGEYIWKYTHNGYDFSILGNTPITFPVEWERSKIPGYAGRVSVPNFHGFSALAVFSSVAARFFTPQIGGAGAVPSVALAGGSTPFRIDHDEKFNLTTHLQYQPWKTGPWFGFNWRYDSGLVAGQTPCFGGNCAQTTVDSTGGTGNRADGLVRSSADSRSGIRIWAVLRVATCDSNNADRSSRSSRVRRLSVPSRNSDLRFCKCRSPNTEDDDKNPPRIAARSLFDVSIGHDNLFRGDKYKVSLQLTAINLPTSTLSTTSFPPSAARTTSRRGH